MIRRGGRVAVGGPGAVPAAMAVAAVTMAVAAVAAVAAAVAAVAVAVAAVTAVRWAGWTRRRGHVCSRRVRAGVLGHQAKPPRQVPLGQQHSPVGAAVGNAEIRCWFYMSL